MLTVDGIIESALYVEDLDRSQKFYVDVFGFEVIDAGARLVALSVSGKQVLLLFLKGASANLPIIAHDGLGKSHLAFAIPLADLAAWQERLILMGIAIEENRLWERGGRSLYFRDPDGHLLEVATPGVWTIY